MLGVDSVQFYNICPYYYNTESWMKCFGVARSSDRELCPSLHKSNIPFSHCGPQWQIVQDLFQRRDLRTKMGMRRAGSCAGVFCPLAGRTATHAVILICTSPSDLHLELFLPCPRPQKDLFDAVLRYLITGLPSTSTVQNIVRVDGMVEGQGAAARVHTTNHNASSRRVEAFRAKFEPFAIGSAPARTRK